MAGTTDWRRTSPIGVLFFLVNAISKVGINALPGLVVVFAALSSASAGRRSLIMTGVLVFVGLAIVAAILSWLRFRFRIDEDRVVVRSGILEREELSIKFDRVQNVNIREPIYMRPFGLALLSIDTAGSGQKEVVLGGIGKSLALDLRRNILTEAIGDGAAPGAVASGDDSDPVLLSRSTRDIVIYGLTANFMIWVAVVLGTLFGASDFNEKFGAWLVRTIDQSAIEAMIQENLGVPLLVVGIAIVFLIFFVLLPLISVLGALFRHHGYQLSVSGETYRKTSGLLSRFDESLKRHKIQAIVLRQNFIAAFFRRTNMQLRVASAGAGTENAQLPLGAGQTFQVPVLAEAELPQLAVEFFPGCEMAQVKFTRINRRRLAMVVLGWGVLPPLLLVSMILALVLSPAFVLLLPIGIGLAWLVVNQVWRKSGFAVAGGFGFVRWGFIGTQETIFPLFKVQRVDIRQTPGQRRRKLARLTIHLASHSLNIPYIPEADARRFRDLALYHAETSKVPWY